ncbi:HNH endonuclease [Nocardioidaceae bacterium]|nr:HNH endonuclease [Nocardioidaceae bacterium]
MIDSLPVPETPRLLVAALQAVQVQQAGVELRRAQLVLAWADAHPGDHLVPDGTAPIAWHGEPDNEAGAGAGPVLGGERAVQPGGAGTPLVAEFALAELGATLGLSVASTRRLVGDLLELRHRLRGCWARVEDLQVPLWRVRRVAQATLDLHPEVAAAVDAQIADRVHTLGPAALDQVVTRTRHRLHPEQAQALLDRSAQTRGVRVFLGDGTHTLTADVAATLDHLDALDLERAVAAGAAALAAGGCTESLDVRRAQALGALARGDQMRLDESAVQETDTARVVELPRASREVVLHVHLSHAALSPARAARTSDGTRGESAWLEQGPLRQAPVELVRQWCGAASTTRITLRPVLDPDAELTSDGYEPSTRLAEQIIIRDAGCVFPDCTRPARSCDLDHLHPYAAGGQTSSANLAPLCRFHHRLKTHGGWAYARTGPGAYEWTSPHRQRFLVTTRPGGPPQTRRLAGLPGGRDGPATIRIDPPPPPALPAEHVPVHAPARELEPASF